MTTIKKAVIPVAGLGTRSLPFSKCIPKEMLPILTTPTIQYIVEECVAAGIQQIILVTSREKTAIEDHFDLNASLEGWLRTRKKADLADRMHHLGTLCDIISIRQKEPLGLGHAILCAEPALGNESFVVCLGDEVFPPWSRNAPPLKQLLETHHNLNTSVVGVVKISPEESSSYGIVDIGKGPTQPGPLKIIATVEKPTPEKAPSDLAIIGRYVFTRQVLDELAITKPGAGGEIQLTDAMDRLAKKGALYALPIEGPRYDMGNGFYFVKAQIDASLRQPEIEKQVRKYMEALCTP